MARVGRYVPDGGVRLSTGAPYFPCSEFTEFAAASYVPLR